MLPDPLGFRSGSRTGVGHSAIEAYEQALKLAAEGRDLRVVVIPLLTDLKVIVRDADDGFDGPVLLYTECPPADVRRIFGVLGITEEHDLTPLIELLHSEGLPLCEAVEVASAVSRED